MFVNTNVMENFVLICIEDVLIISPAAETKRFKIFFKGLGVLSV